MKAQVLDGTPWPPRTLSTRPSSRPPIPLSATTSRVFNDEIREVQDGNVTRICLSVETEIKGEYLGRPFSVTTERFLDGGVTRTSGRFLDGGVTRTSGVPGGTQTKYPSIARPHKEERLTSEAVPARTSNVTDFGRLSVAAQTMAKHLASYTPEKPPSAAQVATLLMNYQNLLKQREEAARRLVQADGEIDTVGRLLSRFVGNQQ